jgi:hypothetical protein
MYRFQSLQKDEIPPWCALLGGVAGTVGAKVLLLFEMAKLLGRKRMKLSPYRLRFRELYHFGVCYLR